jgi:hypothetical protein
MKICGIFLALCVFHPNVWGTTAFLVQTHEAFAVQGGSLKTWTYTASPSLESVLVVLKAESGCPLEADVELWQGPDNTPHKMRVYVEDGSLRPFSAVIETPRGLSSTVAIRNQGDLDSPPLAACLVAADAPVDGAGPLTVTSSDMTLGTIQGGDLRTYAFDPSVERVQVLLETDGLPLNARIELLDGMNNSKQVVDLIAEDGMDCRFYAVIETPGSDNVENVVRVVNTANWDFPLNASVGPYLGRWLHAGSSGVLKPW